MRCYEQKLVEVSVFRTGVGDFENENGENEKITNSLTKPKTRKKKMMKTKTKLKRENRKRLKTKN